MTIADIQADFALLDDWEDRYRYVIELGRAMPPLPDALRTDTNKVRGCASQVWLATSVSNAGVSNPGASQDGGGSRLDFQGDSDALIVRGLVAILIALYRNKTADEILATDAPAVLGGLGLKDHLTPQRSNGVASMVERIRADARAAKVAAGG